MNGNTAKEKAVFATNALLNKNLSHTYGQDININIRHAFSIESKQSITLMNDKNRL